MPKYVVERTIPGAGQLDDAQARAIAQQSCDVLRRLGPEIQWQQSYVTDDKIYCVYIAPNADMIRRHAEEGGFPVDSVAEVKRILDPVTAE